MVDPASGIVLISDPFLKDPNFMRTVVLLCEHNADGSFGFVLNRPFGQQLNDLIPELAELNIPVYNGGPVQPDTLHFVHNLPNLIPNAVMVAKGVYWGGNFEDVITLIRSRSIDLSQIRFFLGYSGWGNGQLESELVEKSWLTIEASHELIFHQSPTEVWKEAVRHLDEAFHPIINYPIDPQLN